MKNKIITWDEYFMSVASLAALRSKDPNTQVGACIVSVDKKIVSVGYNGLPHGCDDNKYPWEVTKGELNDTKYAYVVHAELNAILNSPSPLKNCILYVSLFPCHECVKAIIQCGIKEIVYADDKYNGTSSDKAAKQMLNDAGVAIRKIQPLEIIIKDK